MPCYEAIAASRSRSRSRSPNPKQVTYASLHAEAAAYVLLDVDGERVGGASLDHDTVSASLKAVLSALNRAQAMRLEAA